MRWPSHLPLSPRLGTPKGRAPPGQLHPYPVKRVRGVVPERSHGAVL